MTSEAFVWIWLPSSLEPVVAGRLRAHERQLIFAYGRSYLARDDAISIHRAELPLHRGVQLPAPGLAMAGALRDAAPDAWGRRVVMTRRVSGDLDELTYLLASGSDRIGALDFQASPEVYVPRGLDAVRFDDLFELADRVMAGMPLPPELDLAVFHGSSIGGARPKATIEIGGQRYIAKFSTAADPYNVIKAEYVAMRLAAEVGLNVAPVSLEHIAGRDVLLVERFDRVAAGGGWHRRAMLSALTLFGLDEMMARYASYEDLADLVRHDFTRPEETLHELFARLVLNILVGNTDDHARNHAAFWDGRALSLTPAYDICPQPRTGGVASQAMLIADDDRSSRLATCLAAAPRFRLSPAAASDLIETQLTTIREVWPALSAEARLSPIEARALWRRQLLNPFAFEGAPSRLAAFDRND